MSFPGGRFGVLCACAVATLAAGCSPSGPTSFVKVTAVEPNHAPSGVATDIRITGSGFESGSEVTFGGQHANVVVVNSTTIMGTTPTGVEGTVNVIVRNPDGGQGILYSGFTFVVAVAK